MVETAVTPAIVAVAAGKDAPEGGSSTEQQWAMWIADALMLIDERLKDVAQLIRHHVNQLLLGNLLDGLVFLRNLRVEIFHRRRQVAGEHF